MTHSSDIESTDGFRLWAGSLAPALHGHCLTPDDITASRPAIIATHHGTTQMFDRFDTSVMGNLEGAFGAVHYFTTCEDDARVNYACEGPDMKNRIENEADRLGCEIELDPEAHGLEADAGPDLCLEMARAQLLEKYHGGHERVIDCYLRLNTPFLVYGSRTKGEVAGGGRTPLLIEDLDNLWFTAETEVLADNDIDHEPGSDAWQEALEDYQDEIMERVDAISDEHFDRISVAMMTAARTLGVDTPDLPQGIFEDLAGLTHDRFYRLLCEDEAISYIECPETGAMISCAFISATIEALGFDGIVLFNANEAFPGMDMSVGTTHVHVFASSGQNIRTSLSFTAADMDDQALAA